MIKYGKYVERRPWYENYVNVNVGRRNETRRFGGTPKTEL